VLVAVEYRPELIAPGVRLATVSIPLFLSSPSGFLGNREGNTRSLDDFNVHEHTRERSLYLLKVVELRFLTF
jgi:hypothetical protein